MCKDSSARCLLRLAAWLNVLCDQRESGKVYRDTTRFRVKHAEVKECAPRRRRHLVYQHDSHILLAFMLSRATHWPTTP